MEKRGGEAERGRQSIAPICSLWVSPEVSLAPPRPTSCIGRSSALTRVLSPAHRCQRVLLRQTAVVAPGCLESLQASTTAARSSVRRRASCAWHSSQSHL